MTIFWFSSCSCWNLWCSYQMSGKILKGSNSLSAKMPLKCRNLFSLMFIFVICHSALTWITYVPCCSVCNVMHNSQVKKLLKHDCSVYITTNIKVWSTDFTKHLLWTSKCCNIFPQKHSWQPSHSQCHENHLSFHLDYEWFCEFSGIIIMYNHINQTVFIRTMFP